MNRLPEAGLFCDGVVFSVESEIKEIVLKDCESGHVSGGFAGGGEIHSGPPPFSKVGKMRKINMTRYICVSVGLL